VSNSGLAFFRFSSGIGVSNSGLAFFRFSSGIGVSNSGQAFFRFSSGIGFGTSALPSSAFRPVSGSVCLGCAEALPLPRLASPLVSLFLPLLIL